MVAEAAPSTAADRLDADAFGAFAPLLEACQDYAELSGCRFRMNAFRGLAEEESLGVAAVSPQSLAARRKAAPAVEAFKGRLAAKDEGLLQCAERAHRLVMSESVRNGIVATCRELGLWPPDPAPAGVDSDDCTYEDTSAPLPLMAQRAFNEATRREREPGLQVQARRAATASFIVDFVCECGVALPALAKAHEEMLQEFMARVEEWSNKQPQESAVSQVTARARDALLLGLGLGHAADAARQQLQARWSKNWETPGGTLLNVATVGLALVAGLATLRRATRAR